MTNQKYQIQIINEILDFILINYYFLFFYFIIFLFFTVQNKNIILYQKEIKIYFD
jgi:hypothetical protein